MKTDLATYPDHYAPYFDLLRNEVIAFPRCNECHAFHWYPKPSCPACGSSSLSWIPAPATGHLYSWTVVHRKFDADFGEDPPYVVALIEFKGMPGVRLVSSIRDCAVNHLKINMEVEPFFRITGQGQPLVYFKPATGK